MKTTRGVAGLQDSRTGQFQAVGKMVHLTEPILEAHNICAWTAWNGGMGEWGNAEQSRAPRERERERDMTVGFFGRFLRKSSKSESKQHPHGVVWKINVFFFSSLRANRQNGSTSDGLKRRLNKPRRRHGRICASAPPNVLDNCVSRRLSSPITTTTTFQDSKPQQDSTLP